jgi:hypothetical protein
MTCLVTPAQVPTIIDLTMKGSHGVESFDPLEQDKWAASEERLRVVKGFDVYNPVRAVEIYLMLDVVVPKKFRVLEFIKYTWPECPKTHLSSYYNKMAEVICDEKLLIHFF